MAGDKVSMDVRAAFDLLEKLELRLADMYEYFAAQFADNRDVGRLFMSMSNDETAHRDLIKFQRRLLSGKDRTMVDIHKAEVLAIMERVGGIITQPHFLADALRISFEIESSSAEYHYRTASRQVSPEMADLVAKLGDADNAHFGKLKTFVNKFFTMEELRKEFAQYQAMLEDWSQRQGQSERLAKEDTRAADDPGGLAEEDPRTTERINRMFDHYKELDYYRVLSVTARTTVEHVKKSYHLALRQWHPDNFPSLGSGLMAKLNEITSYINNAYETLSDKEKRTAYDQSLRERAEQGLTLVPVDEQKAVSGWSRYSKGDYSGALKDFRAAIRLAPKAKHYHYYAMALNKAGKPIEAMQAIEQAVRKAPKNIDCLIEAGNIYLGAEDYRAAEESFKKVLKLVPKNMRAINGLNRVKAARPASFIKRLFRD